MRQLLRNHKGQNTLEYILMIVFVVGIVMILFKLFQPQFQGLVGQVTDKIRNAISSMGGGG
ncbi:MAG: hypothetical protein HY390_06490 [Deltaproteobacteria bacterium]|nr:hypothetical protein [Deltaproteobacteria bacterium]